MAASDFHFFPTLKDILMVTDFRVTMMSKQQWQDGSLSDAFYEMDKKKLVLSLDKCLSRYGEYAEK